LIAFVIDENNQSIIIEVAFYFNGTLLGTVYTNSSGIAMFLWKVDTVPGDYIITATVKQSDVYWSSLDEKNLTINKTSSHLSSEDIFMYFNQTKVLYIYLYFSGGGITAEYIWINITGVLEQQLLTNSSGWAEWTCASLSPGIYNLNIQYLGNSFFNPYLITISIQVDKMPSTISFNAPNQYYTPLYLIDGYIVDIESQPISSVQIQLLINSSLVQTVLSNTFGYFSFEILLEPGTYVVEILFEGDSGYLPDQSSKTVYIWKIETTIQTTVIWENFTLKIESILKDKDGNGIEGKQISFYLNGSLIGTNVTDTNGFAIYIKEDLSPGVYEIEIKFQGDNIYKSSSQLVLLEQNKLQTEVTVQIQEGIYATKATRITVQLTSEGKPLVGENVLLLIDGVEYYGITNSSGFITLSLDLYLSAGSYSLVFTYDGSVDYSSINYETNFAISKAETIIELIYEYRDYQPTIRGQLIGQTTMSNEELKIFINGSYFDSIYTDSNGEYFTILSLPSGNYELSVIFEGDSNYLSSTSFVSVKIYKTPTKIISLNNSFNQTTFGEESILTFQLLDALNQPIETEVNIILDGNYLGSIMTNSSGIASFLLPSSLIVGSHDIVIEYLGNQTYYQSSLSINFQTKYKIVLLKSNRQL